MEIFEIIYEAAWESFINVGSFVAVTLFIFNYINYKFEGRFIEAIEKNKKTQVITGSCMGLTPGCGGAIMVIPLYLLKKVSFGTIAATLIATMGDASFILISRAPGAYIGVLAISFIVAIITGYIMDYFNLGDSLIDSPKDYCEIQLSHENFQDIPTEFELNPENIDHEFRHIGHIEGDAIDMALHHGRSKKGVFHYFRHTIGYKIFWVLALISLPLGILEIMMVDIDSDLIIKNLSLVGFVGTLFSIIYTIISKKILADDSHAEVESKLNSLKETIIHNAEETAFVVTWVFLALVGYEIFVELIGGELIMEGFIQNSGYMAIVAAVLIGLIPGCGPQIILATLFIQGNIPFSALVANAICNDGDALFPLIALNKKSALYVKFYNLIPAIIVGTLLYFIGF